MLRDAKNKIIRVLRGINIGNLSNSLTDLDSELQVILEGNTSINKISIGESGIKAQPNGLASPYSRASLVAPELENSIVEDVKKSWI